MTEAQLQKIHIFQSKEQYEEHVNDVSESDLILIPIDNILSPSNLTPLGPSSNGSIGTSTNYAREDHAHPEQSDVSGNAGSADRLKTPRNISFSGDVSCSYNFDGSENSNASMTVNKVSGQSIISSNSSIQDILNWLTVVSGGQVTL